MSSSATSTHLSEQSYYLVSSSFSKLHTLLTEKGHQFLAVQNFSDQFSVNNSWSALHICKWPTDPKWVISWMCCISHNNCKPDSYHHPWHWKNNPFSSSTAEESLERKFSRIPHFPSISDSQNNLSQSCLLSTSSGRLALEISQSEPCNALFFKSKRTRMEDWLTIALLFYYKYILMTHYYGLQAHGFMQSSPPSTASLATLSA